MSFLSEKALNLKFPHGEHDNCRALTALTLENVPKDKSFGRERRYQRNAIVWQPDDRSDRLYFVESGGVGVFSVDRDGHEVVLRTAIGGEPFGELCFCGGPTKVRRTTARATTNSVVIEINIEDFLGYMRKDTEILARVVFTFCMRLADAEQRVEILALRGAEERLGNALLHFSKMRGVTVNAAKRNAVVQLHVTHDELAGLTALSRQRVTITMNRFRELGLVSYDRNHPLLVNTAELAEFLAADVY